MKAFIPSWLNQARLSQADFRVYCCLASRADNATGIAWPNAETIAADCAMARNTVWRSIERLEKRHPPLIRRVGKRFQGSNRYQVLTPTGANGMPVEPPTGANEMPVEPPTGANGTPVDVSPIGANETPPIGANEILQPAQINSREGNPKKEIQGRKSKKGQSDGFILPFPSEEFSQAWKNWQTHRKEKGKPVTPLSATKQLSQLSEMGEARAIAAIDHSIANGWTGAYEPSSRSNSNNGGGKKTMTPAQLAAALGGRTPKHILDQI